MSGECVPDDAVVDASVDALSDAEEEEGQDRERGQANDDLIPGDAAQLREPSPDARRIARRGERCRGALVAGGYEAVLRLLRAPNVLAEAASWSRPRQEADGRVVPMRKSR